MKRLLGMASSMQCLRGHRTMCMRTLRAGYNTNRHNSTLTSPLSLRLNRNTAIHSERRHIKSISKGANILTNIQTNTQIRHASALQLDDPRITSAWPRRTPAKFKRLARDAGASTYRGRKRSNEDRFIICDLMIGKVSWLLAAVFDGHGGQEAAEFAHKNYHSIILKHLDKCSSISEALRDSFIDLDEQFSATEEATKTGFVGTTGTVAIVNGTDLHVAYVGDSPAYLYHTNGEFDPLIIPHNPMNPVEKARVKEVGGSIVTLGGIPRLNGACTVTRAIGDVALKQLGMIANPAVQYRQISNSNGFLLLGTDGLFDGMDCESIFQMVKGSKHPSEAVRRMEVEAEIGGSLDNITSIVIPLDGWFPMLTPIEKGPMYKFLTNLSEATGHRPDQLERFTLLLRAYLPNDTTDDELLAMKEKFMKTGRGEFGLAAFRVFDEDGDGEISYEEMWSLYQLVGSNYSREEVRALFEIADQDGDGGIGFGEFRTTMRALMVFADSKTNK